MAVELATAYISLVPSFRGGVGAIQGEARKMGTAMSDTMAGEIDKSTRSGGRLSRAFSGIGGALAGGLAVGAGLTAVTNLVGGFISEAEDAAKVARETANVIRSTGSAANVTAQDIDTLASALSAKAAVDDEVIASGANVLLTFTRVANQAGAGNDIFNQATAIALDMSEAMGTDLQGAVVQVGKALNDPIAGMSALSRVGVQFTEQQKAQIEALVASGDQLGAQKLILAELTTQFGGAAAAGATSSEKLSVAWGNVQEQLGTVLLPIFDKVATWLANELPGAIQWAQEAMAPFVEAWRKYGDEIMTVVRVLFTWIQTQVKIFMTAIKIEWAVISAIVTFFNDWVVRPLRAAVTGLIDFFTPAIQGGVAAVRAAWNVIENVYTFFRDRIQGPLMSSVGAIRDGAVLAFQETVGRVAAIWRGILDVYTFFRERVYDPIRSTVIALRDNIKDAFQAAVDGVKSIWDRLASIVKTPINLVIGFYNAGIRGVWNAVISKIPGVGDLPSIAHLNRGGVVPGSGNRDTVPAMLTPGEFVVTKKAAQTWGPEVLRALNNPNGTIDPGIFGYATGGYVRSADEALAWARAQAGKPYRFPDVGPATYDCSGFTSALINFILGRNPHSRRHSSGSMGSDPALRPGDGGNPMGGLFGARPPYMTNSVGARVGHTTATLMGVNMEATPPAVRVGGNARGARSLTQLYHLPGYGGLSDADKQVVTSVAGLRGASLSGMQPPLGDLLQTLFNKLPGIILDFFMKKLPQLIVDAVRDVFTQDVRGSVAFAHGGTVRKPGPIEVGENGRERIWADRGMYVEANADRGGRGRQIVINNNQAPFDLDRAYRQALLLV
jgi:hypothetical protein